MKANRKAVPILFAFVIATLACPRDAAQISQSSQNPSSSVATIWEPPTAELWHSIPNATVPKEMVSKLTVAGASVVLETTQLRTIATRFSSTIGRRGDAGNSVRWLCFRGSDSGGQWALWLKSYEIDGGTVGGFEWQRIGNGAVFDRRCRTLGAGSVELPDKLGLGLTREEVKTALGHPTAERGDAVVYVHSHELSIRGQPFTSENIAQIAFRQGKVQSIGVSKTTTD